MGSKLIPEHAIESPGAAMGELLHSLGLTAMRDSIAATGFPYNRHSHIQGYNLEKYCGAGEDYDSLGMNTMGGESIQVQISGNTGGAANNACPIDRIYMVIVSSMKVELRTGSCRVRT